jgi:hypothetical protein
VRDADGLVLSVAGTSNVAARGGHLNDRFREKWTFAQDRRNVSIRPEPVVQRNGPIFVGIVLPETRRTRVGV